MNKKTKYTIGFIIWMLYFASLFMECYYVNESVSIGSFGFFALLLGWINFNFIGVIWLSNPLFLISLILFLFTKKIKTALILSAIAFTLSLSFMYVDDNMPINEAVHYGKVTGYRLGYWFWVSANLSLFGVLLFNNIKSYYKNTSALEKK